MNLDELEPYEALDVICRTELTTHQRIDVLEVRTFQGGLRT
jgi:hypothetical protein